MYKNLLKIFFLIFLAGCAQQAILPTRPPTLNVKPTAQLSQVPTNSLTVETKSSFTVHSYCPEISNGTSSLANLTGTIVLGGEKISLGNQEFSPDGNGNSVLLFWNTHSGNLTTYQLPEKQMYYYYVASPDKEHLALTEGKTLEETLDVVVLNKDGQEESKFPLPGDWTLFDWLNDEKLLVRQMRLIGPNKDLIAVNPFTHEQQILKSDFPNIYSREPFVIWGAQMIFNPTLSKVVYAELQKNFLTAVLWDIENNREVARITEGGLPRWSPDGKRLLLVVENDPQQHRVSDEIYTVSGQGEVNQATFLTDNLKASIINLPVWSPDGRYIAFWLSSDLPIHVAKLAVLDTETSSIDMYCKEFNPFPFRFGEDNTLGYAYNQVNAAVPIWSPDSQYLLIEDYSNFTSNSYMFDLKYRAVTHIAEQTRPVGWLK